MYKYHNLPLLKKLHSKKFFNINFIYFSNTKKANYSCDIHGAPTQIQGHFMDISVVHVHVAADFDLK